jgi:hypothetical protein
LNSVVKLKNYVWAFARRAALQTVVFEFAVEGWNEPLKNHYI